MKLPVLSFLLLTGLGLLFLACGEKKDPPATTAEETPPFPERPGLFIVGNDHGMIRPCGCSKPLLGGIVRRGAFVAALPESLRTSSTFIAVGGMIEEGGRQQELKLEAFLESLETLDARVLFVNEHDLLVGSRFWKDLLFQRSADAMPIVATNLSAQGESLFEPFRIIRHEDREVVVASWLWPDSGVLSEPGLDLQAEPEIGELMAALENEGAEARDLIFYSSAPEPLAKGYLVSSGLLERAARVLLLLTGPSDLPVVLSAEDDYLACEMGQKGRDITRLDWPQGQGLEHFSLVESYGGNKRQQEILDFYRGNVAAENLLLSAPKFEMAEDAYAGTEACANCHRDAHATWSDSRHAHAFETLVKVGDDRDPECVRCHVVDFHRQGGFDPVSVEPVDVQCEACHGPSASHAADPREKTPRGQVDRQTCLVCHDLANSPHFEYETYWPKIQHGK